MVEQPTPAGLDTAVVLAGGGVLDGYLALGVLSPQHGVIVHGPSYGAESRRLASAAHNRLGVRTRIVAVEDDDDFAHVMAVGAQFPPGAHLVYTGGTGLMAAALRTRFERDGRPPSDASTLDRSRRLLRLDDGTDLALDEFIDPRSVDIEAVLALSGFEERHDAGVVRGRQDRFAELIAAALDRYHPSHHAPASRMLHDLQRALRERTRNDRDGAVRDWANGRFFEDLVRHFVSRVAPSHDVRSGLMLSRAGLRMELDVVAVGHYRPYVISCAVGGQYDPLRMKMFEVLHRTRQVGGSVARCALACTLAEDAAVTPEELEALARESPEPGDEPVVFGAADIAGWIRGDHRALNRLARFLES